MKMSSSEILSQYALRTVSNTACLRSNDFYCEFDQSGVAVAGATAAMNARQREDVTVPLQYSPKIMHAQEVAQEVLAPQEHASRKKK